MTNYLNKENNGIYTTNCEKLYIPVIAPAYE